MIDALFRLLNCYHSFTIFTPQPSGLEGYYHHSPGRRLPDLHNPYLCNGLTDFLRSKFCGIVWACSCALSWPFTHMPYMGMPIGEKLKFATNWVQTLQNTFFWNCWMDLPHLSFHGLLDMKLCNAVLICPFAPYGLAYGSKTCQIRQHFGHSLWNPYLWNRWMDLYHLKFFGIV